MKKQTNSTGWECPILSRYLMNLLLLLVGLIGGAGSAWADEVTLFTTNFSATDGWTNGAITAGSTQTINGTIVTFKAACSVDTGTRKFTFPANNAGTGNDNWIVIPVSNINGSIKISVANGTSNMRFNYAFIESSEYSRPSSIKSSISASPSVEIISDISATSGLVLIGRQGSGLTDMTNLTITTPSSGGGSASGDIIWTFDASNIENSASFGSRAINTFIAKDGTHKLVFKGNSDSDVLETSNAGTVSGVSYTTDLKTNGATSSNRYFSFSGISGNGYLTVVVQATSSGSRTIGLSATAGTTYELNTITTSVSGKTAYKSSWISGLEASKTYYVNISGGISLYSIIWTPSNEAPSVKPTAKFTYGQTVFPQETTMDLTVPAHKAGSSLTVNLSNVTEGATASGTGLSDNTLTIPAPAAGSNSQVEVTVTDNNDASNKTVYTINVKTETKTGTTFDENTRYSKLLIEARKNDFYSNTNSGGLGYGSNLDYVPGLVAKAMIDAVDYYKDHQNTEITNDLLASWYNSVKTYGSKSIASNGTDGKSFDDLNATKIYFGLKKVAASGKVTGIEAYSDANTKLSSALSGIKNANTSYSISSSHATYPISTADMQGGWWHKADYINQMWGDGQYMGTALLAQLINDADVYDASNSDKRVTANDWDVVANQIKIYHKYAWDNTANLPHHAFAADKGTNSTSHSDTWKMDGDTYHNEGIWGRATGWYFMALVDILEQMPSSHADYNTIKGYLSAVASGIKARQDNATGCWYQLPLYDHTFSAAEYNNSAAQPGRVYNYLESSATALYTAAYFKAIRLGLLDKATYEATAKKAYQGIIENFMSADNNLYWCCRSAGLGGKGDASKENGAKFRDGSNAYYLKGNDVAPTKVTDTSNKGTEGKVLGAFIMAATEYERAYLEKPVASITLDKTKAYIEYNTTTQLTAIVLPDNATNKDVNWSTSNDTRVSVSTTGLVKGKYAYGATEKITATAADGSEVSADCDVYVYRFSKTGTAKQDYVVGDNGESTQIYTVFPDEGGNVVLNIADFEVTSTDNDIVSSRISSIVDNKLNMPITIGSKVGSATLTITYKGSNVNYYGKTCTLTYTVEQGKSSNTTPIPSTGSVNDETKVITAPVVNNEYESTRFTLGLPAGATATVSNAQGTEATIEDGVLIYKSPAAGTHVEMMIRITAEDGITTQDYTVWVETASAPVVDEVIYHIANQTTSVGTSTIGNSSIVKNNTVKILNNNTNAISFGSNITKTNDNYLKLEPKDGSDGFKAGDIVSITDCQSRDSYDSSIGIVLYDENRNEVLFTSIAQNVKDGTTNPVAETYVLKSATSCLYIGRTGGGTVYLTEAIVTRPAPKAHTVTFNINNHSASSIPASETESEIGAGVTLPKPTPFAGYTFLGWSTDQNATAADDGLWAYMSKYYPSQDVTIYAVYRQNPIGSQHTPFWKSFSDFVQLENGKAYTATFNNEGGDASYKNWVLIATKDANGHNGDGVQTNSSNEIFCLRADGGYWSPSQSVTTAGKVYRYDAASSTYEEINATTDADFVTDMSAGDANVNFSMSRVNNRLYLYAVTTCANDAQYIQTYESGEITGDIYLSFTTENSKISSLNGNTNKAANLVVKETGGKTVNGTVDDIVSLEGISLMNKGVAEGTKFKVKTTPVDGYELDAVYVNEQGYWTSTEFPMPATEAVVGASFKTTQKTTYNYTVKAIKADGTVLREIATGTCNAGDAVTVAYPQYILNGTTLYGIRNNSTGDYYRTTFTPDQDNYVLNLTYNYNNKENVVYYTEAEDISGLTKVDYTNRASNGQVAYGGLVATTATLPAGNYQIFIRGLNGNSAARTATFTDETNALATISIEQGTNIMKNSPVFTLDAEKTIYVSCDGSSSSGLDWFYIQKINALNVTQNEQKFEFTTSSVTAANYATANAASTSGTQTHDGVTGQFYNIKNSSNYVEVSEMNAIAFKVFAFHGNSKDTRKVDVYVDGEKVGTVDVTPGGVSSQVFAIPGTASDIHSIKLTGTGNDVYVADIVFYTSKTAPTVTPANVTVSALQTKQFDVNASDGCTITSMNTVSSDVADVTYNDGKITVQGKKAGELNVTFVVDATGSSIFEGTAATVHITVTKADLVMKYNPDSYTVNADEDTPELPAYELKYYVVEDGVERVITSPAVTITYNTDDSSVATVDGSGTISLVQNANGSANISATSVENDVFNAAKAYFTVNITKGIDYKVSSKPNIGDKFQVTKDGNTYVYGTYGGWKRNGNAYKYDDAETGGNKSRSDDWKAVETYNNAIDGFSKYSSGVNDAMDEDMSPNTEVYYGVKRNGWFESPLKLKSIAGDGTKTYKVSETNPFSLPVRGTYMTFEPTVNGQLTIYILQNGAWNSLKDDITDNDGFLISVGEDGKKLKFPGMAPWQFRPHSFHVTDQNGMPVALYTDFKINTKQTIQSGIITEEQLNAKKDGKDVYTEAQKQMVRKYCETYGVKLGDKFKCITNPSEEGYNDATNIGNWKEFKEYMSAGEQARVKAAWNTGVNGAQQVVEMDNGSFLAVDECIMKYTFYVAAGQTYYLFSNFSKMGFSGCNFVPDETPGSLPTATLDLSETTKYSTPVLNSSEGLGNHVKNISVPQYKDVTISFSQTYSKTSWNTLCLPFTVTEKETAEIFGAESDGLELLIMSGFEVEGTKATISFVYHEIQNILAGYPYLIKSGKDGVTSFTVHNKLIDPATTLKEYSFNGYTFKGVDGFCTPGVHTDSNKNYFSLQLKQGDLFLSGNKFWQSAGSSYLRGYRAYIKSPASPGAKNLTAITLSFGSADNSSNTTTSIEFVDVTPDASEVFDYVMPKKGVYNMSGQKVAGTVVGLPSGLYIVNGKKIVIK